VAATLIVQYCDNGIQRNSMAQNDMKIVSTFQSLCFINCFNNWLLLAMLQLDANILIEFVNFSYYLTGLHH